MRKGVSDFFFFFFLMGPARWLRVGQRKRNRSQGLVGCEVDGLNRLSTNRHNKVRSRSPGALEAQELVAESAPFFFHGIYKEEMICFFWPAGACAVFVFFR